MLNAKDKLSFFTILRRKKILIFGISLLGFSISALIAQNVEPSYIAKAQIIFNKYDPIFLASQKEYIKSFDITIPTILKLKLVNNDNKKYDKKNSKFKNINIYETKLPSLSGKIIAKDIEPIITNFQKSLSVDEIPNSSIINIEYKEKSPENAAIILNEIINQYISSITPENSNKNNEYKIKIIKKLNQNTQKAQNSLALLEEKIEEIKEYINSNINNNSINDEKEISHKYYEAIANYEKAKTALANANSINSPLMQKLKFRHNKLKQKLKSLSTTYGTKHPDIIYLNTQISNIEKEIEEERKNIISRLKTKYEQAKIDLKHLKPIKKNNNNDNVATINNVTIKKNLQILQEQAKQIEQIFNEYKNIYEEKPKKIDSKEPPIKSISQVVISTNTSLSQKTNILIYGFSISLILGILIAIFSEKLRNNFLSSRQIEEYLNIPCYALIPRVEKNKNKPLSKYVINNPASNTAEAIKSLYLTIKLYAQSKNKNYQIITITSSLPNEGKSVLSSWLAQIIAKSGKKTILIDADLRKSSIHKIFEKENKLSLAEYLSGKNKLHEIIDKDTQSNLHIIYARPVPNNAFDLITSNKMEQLISHLCKNYDHIIIDTPASMAVSDAVAINKLSDQLIYTISWNKTKRKTVHNGISQFTKFDNSRIATVLTNIDVKKHVELGYGEVVNYYGSYK